MNELELGSEMANLSTRIAQIESQMAQLKANDILPVLTTQTPGNTDENLVIEGGLISNEALVFGEPLPGACDASFEVKKWNNVKVTQTDIEADDEDDALARAKANEKLAIEAYIRKASGLECKNRSCAKPKKCKGVFLERKKTKIRPIERDWQCVKLPKRPNQKQKWDCSRHFNMSKIKYECTC